MPRYRITIEYDGTPFVGWQMQVNGPSVQASLAEAILRFTKEPVQIQGAGRTDTGVHARGQTAHFDLVHPWPPDKIRDAANYHLRPLPIAIIECTYASDTFDARFSATARHYLYRILQRRAPAVLECRRVWQVPVHLDAARMQEAAAMLVGRFDFTTFRAAGCQAKSPLRTLDRLDVAETGGEIHIHACARAFLHNQVRSMVGCLKAVGEGRWSLQDFIEARDARDRRRCAAVAPAHGLYLMAVDYPVGASETLKI
ncbi:MAG: tRNA pseudouridine(38-40) synthase TruA [Pseudomonadota bacterium]